MAIPYTRTSTALALVVGFVPSTIPSSHPNFDKLCELVKDPNTTDRDVEPLLNIPKAINTFTGGNVTVVNGRLFYKGFEVKSTLATVILNFVKAGDTEAAKPFERFMEKAFANPDPRAVEGLYDWLVAGKLPITPDGDILAWKAVQADYYSIHSGPRGKLRHQIGDVVSEPRHETNGNPDQTCSRGIHFCSIGYLQKSGYASGGSRIMAVTISPTNVVAFPRDYGLTKGRACELTVVGEVPLDQVPTFYPNGAMIYGGWSNRAPVAEVAATPARAMRTFTEALRDGDKVRLRDGRTAIVENYSTNICRLVDLPGNRIEIIYRSNGRGYRSEDVSHDRGFDVIEVIERAPTLTKRLDLRVGDTVRMADGSTQTVGRKSGYDDTDRGCVMQLLPSRTYVFASTGSGSVADPGKPERAQKASYVTEVLTRAPRTPRNNGGIAVGQIWTSRKGEQRTIADINAGGSYPVRDDKGARYTASGRYDSDNTSSQFDLVRLTKDVA